MRKKALASFIFSAALVGCASPTVVTERQAGDENMSCEQLLAASQEAQEFEREARDERGVTGTNAAAVVFFWPGLIGTYANTAEAIDAARTRQTHLMSLYSEKGCSSSQTSQSSGASSDIAGQLRELRSMFEEGLMTEEEYNAARTKALGL